MKTWFKEKLYFNLTCLILLTGLIITYSNHFNNSFHFDDDHAIVNNIWIKDIKNIPKFFTDATTFSILPQNQSYRPGTVTLSAIDFWISKHNPLGVKKNELYQDEGLNPFYFHLSIFIAFILQALLMFLFFKKILDNTIKHKWDDYFALFITAWYCYHTAIAETVNYICARTDGFSTLLILFAFVIYAYFPRKRKYGFFLIPYIAGFLVKEPSIMFGPLLFFYILLIEKKADLTTLFKKETFGKALQSLKAVAVTLIIAIFLYGLSIYMRPDTFSPSSHSTLSYLITQPFVYVHYFMTFILPANLSADSDWRPLSTIFDIRLLMGLMFIAGMIWFAIRISKNKALLPVSFGIFWFFLALAPSSSFIALSEVLNDHRIYFPYVGLVLAFSVMLIYLLILKDEKRFLNSIYIRVFTGVLVFGLICGHAYGTHQRNKVWKTEETLWYDVTVKSPGNGRGLMNYGLTQMSKGNYPVAKKYFEKGLKLQPGYPLLFINLGILNAAMGNPAEAENYYKRAVAINLYQDESYSYYGEFLYSQKRYDEAKACLKNALNKNSSNMQARFALMALYYDTEDWGALSRIAEETLQYLPNDAKCLAYIDASKNKKTKLDVAIETAKNSPTSDNYINLSLHYYEAGMYAECITACEEALKINPDNAIAYNNICSAYNALKMYDKAIAACNKALEIDPVHNFAKGNLNYAKEQLNK